MRETRKSVKITQSRSGFTLFFLEKNNNPGLLFQQPFVDQLLMKIICLIIYYLTFRKVIS